MYHGIKSTKGGCILGVPNSFESRKKHYEEMIYDDKDACMVNMFEAFLESAPQLTLQAYVVITEYDAEKDNLLRTYQHLKCMTLFPTKYLLQIALYLNYFTL